MLLLPHFHFDFEETVESGVVLHLQPDGIGKIDLAEYLVGAGGVGRGIPADGGQSVRADRDCRVETAVSFVRIGKRDVLGPCGNAIAAENLHGKFDFKPQRTGETGEIKIRMTDEESK